MYSCLLLTYIVMWHWEHWPTYIDVWPGSPCSLAWLVVDCNRLGGGSFRGRPISLSRTELLNRLSKDKPCSCCPAELQLLVGRCRLRGIAYVYVRLEFSYEPPPQKATLDSMRTLSWFVSYRRLSPQFQVKFLCLQLLYVCISMIGTTLQVGGKV